MAATKSLILSFAILFLFSLFAHAEDDKPCSAHPLVSGQCFDIRGRLAFYNGSPSIRIWPVGTNRLIGVSEGKYYLNGYSNIPPELVSQLSFGKAMYATFQVCPFTENTPGVMQLVCIQSATNVTVKSWP